MTRTAAANPTAHRLRELDLNLLPVLDALLMTRGVSAAGLRLGLSQSRVSGALSRLREVLQDPLLIRTGNRMLLTPLAEELLPRVGRLMEDIEATVGSAAKFLPSLTRRVFRIAATDYTAHVVLPGVVQRMREIAPHSALEVFSCETRASDLLATRQVDLLLADRWLVREERSVRSLFSETFVGLVRAGHPRLTGATPSLDSYLGEEHALIAPRGLSPGNVDSALLAIGRSRRVVVTLPYYLAAAQFVATTDLVLTLPRRIAHHMAHDARLRQFDVPVRVPGFDVVCVRYHGSRHDGPVEWLERQVAWAGRQIQGMSSD